MSSVQPKAMAPAVVIDDLLSRCQAGLGAAEAVMEQARLRVTTEVTRGGRIDSTAFDSAQFAAHGYAWLATYVEALRQMLDWATRLQAGQRLRETEQLILQIAFGEYLAQIAGGLAMSQGEIVRPADLGLTSHDLAVLEPLRDLIDHGNTASARARLAALITDGDFGEAALDDETLLLVQDQFRHFAEAHRDAAHQWHLKDELIPLEVIQQLAEMGVFGLTVPEEFGGAGLGKLAMCVVTEELSRGYIGLGSLGTRSEIAAELIRLGGTEQQKQHWLPKLASGEILPTAVFTEPNTGSDLGALRTR
ncbi:MAG TPA: acyl-CoA dehydrogenase family protein, partial [Dongiaceae bacterium]